MNLKSIIYLTRQRQATTDDKAIHESLVRSLGVNVKLMPVEVFIHSGLPQQESIEKNSNPDLPDLIVNASGCRISSGIPVLHCDLFDACRNKWFPRITAALRQNSTILCFSIYLNREGKALGRRARIRIIPHDYNQSRSLSLIFFQSLLLETLDDYRNGRMEAIPTPEPVENDSASIGNRLGLCFQTSLALLKHQWHKRTSGNQWQIGIIDQPLEKVALTEKQMLQVDWFRFHTQAEFNADPFGFSVNGQAEVLYEGMVNGKGEIRMLGPEKGDSLWMQSGHHLSYPYTLLHDNQWYVLPEQHASQNLTLYRYNEETNEPEPVAVLLEHFAAVDPSLIYYDKKWWLFCTNAADKGADHRLYIFYSDHLDGPYQPHQRNPVKTDVCSARPAGHLFIHDHKLYRTSQDSGTTYGGNIVIQQVTKLNPAEFEEKEVNRIGPRQLAPGTFQAVHTLSRLGSKCLIDARADKKNRMKK